MLHSWRSYLLLGVIHSFLTWKFSSSTCPAYEVPEHLGCAIGSRWSVDTGAFCTSTTEAAGYLCGEALKTLGEYRTGSATVGSSMTVTLGYSVYVNTIEIRQASDLAAQIDLLQVTFDDGTSEYVNLTKNSALPLIIQKFSFATRNAKTIKLTPLSVHPATPTTPTSGHGYTFMWAYHDRCLLDLACDIITIPAGTTTSALGTYTSRAFFSIKGASEMHIILSSGPPTADMTSQCGCTACSCYIVKVGAVANTKYSLDKVDSGTLTSDVASKTDFNILSATKYREFWIEFKTPEVILGRGAEILLMYNDTQPITALYVVLANKGTQESLVYFCNRKVRCYQDAAYYWPLDTPLHVDTVSEITVGHPRCFLNGITEGPTINRVRTAAAIKLSSCKAKLVDAKDKCPSDIRLCRFGLTVTFWCKIDTAATGLQILVSSNTASPGFRVNFDATSNNIDALVYDSATEYKATGKATKGKWHHVAFIWHPIDGLTLILDLMYQYTGVTTANSRATDTNTWLVIGQANDMSGSVAAAAISTLVIWERALSISDVQNRVKCSGLSADAPMINANGTVLTPIEVPDDALTASSSKSNSPPRKSRLFYNKDPSDSGSWAPQTSNVGEYLQLDVGGVMHIEAIATRARDGSSPEYITTFRVTYSLDGENWKDYKYNDVIHIFPGNTEPINIVTSYLCNVTAHYIRVYPLTWFTWPSLRLAVLVKGEAVARAANFVGCMTGITTTASVFDINPITMTPAQCVTSCAIKGLAYALLAKGLQCYCSSAASSNGPEERCHFPCKGNLGVMCGSYTYYSVYATKETLPTTYDVTLPPVKPVFEPFTFTSSRIPFTLDVGDGEYKYKEASNEFMFTSVGNQEAVFSTTVGTYSSLTLQAVKTSHAFANLSGVEMVCPLFAESLVPFTCELSIIAGDNITLDTTLNDTAPEQSSVEAPITMFAGQSTPPSSRAATPGAQSGDRSFLLLGSVFSDTGYLKSFVVDGYKKGSLRFQIYRPFCIEGGKTTYCYIDGNCTTTPPRCPVTVSPPHTCPAGKPFAPSVSQCVQNNLVCPATGVTPPVPALAASYEVVYDQEGTIKEGLQMVVARKNSGGGDFEVREGDITGFRLPAGNTSAEVSSSASSIPAKYFANKKLTLGMIFAADASLLSSTLLSHVGAVYVVPTNMGLDMNLSTGYYTFKSTTANSYNLVNLINLLRVVERVANVTWIYETIVAHNKSVNITVLAHKGSNVTHLIDINNVTVKTSFSERVNENQTFEVLFGELGNANLLLTAVNIISSETTACAVKVIQDVNYVNFTSIPATILTHVTNITFLVDGGTEVTCNLTLDGGYFDQFYEAQVNGSVTLFVVKTFLEIGEYWANVTCFNPVSSQFDRTMLIVEKPITGLTCAVVHANRDIEVNETISFVVTKVTGTNTLLNYTILESYSVLTRNLSIQNSFITWRWYTSNISIWNNVSSDNCSVVFQVHKPVYPIIITSFTCAIANFSTPSYLMMNISSGNDYICDYDYGDGQNQVNASNYKTLGQHVLHTYASVGYYYVRVTCVNRLYTGSNVTMCRVLHPITNLTLTLAPAHAVSTEIIGNFATALGTNVTYNATFGYLVNKSLINIQNAVLRVTTETTMGEFSVAALYTSDIGLALVILTAVNDVTSMQTKYQEIYLVRPIEGLYLRCPHPYVEVNHVSHFYASTVNGSRVTLIWDFKDGVRIKRNFTGDEFEIHGHNLSHAYASNGTFEVNLTVTNPLGGVEVGCHLFVQHPLVNITLTTNSPQIIPTGEVTYTFQVGSGTPCPTNATIDLVYGTVASQSGIPFGQLCHSIVKVAITAPGVYWVNISLQNAISSISLNTTIEVQREIKDLVGMANHTGGNAGYGAPGRGPAYDIFPLEFPININTRVSDGSNIVYSFYYGDGTSNRTMEPQVIKNYHSRGTYNIRVFAKNAVSRMWYNFSVTMMESNLKIMFNNNGPSSIRQMTSLTIHLDQIGYQSCCLIDLTNKTYFIYKDETATTCKPSWTALTKNVGVFPQRENTSITWQFKFWQMQYYYTTAICENTVSTVQQGRYAIVLPVECKFPGLSIPGFSKNCQNARKFLKSRKIDVISKNNIHCFVSRKTDFVWSLKKLYGPLNSSGIIVSDLPADAVTDRGVLELPPRSLEYGYYEVCLNVSVRNVWLVDSSICVCIKVEPSPLQCFIWGGNGWKQSFFKEAKLDGRLSYDPDLPPDTNKMGIENHFYCKLEGENYSFPDESNQEPVASGNSSGCFGKGPGRLDTTTDVLTYAPETLLPNATYVFRYYCRKVSRLGYFDVTLHMTPLDPPQCAMRILRQTLYRTLLVSSKSTFEAVCSDPDLEIQWSVYEANNGSWRLLTNLADKALSPPIGRFLVLPPGYFHGNRRYKAEIRITGESGPPGRTYYMFNTHREPHNGTCDAIVSEQTADKEFTFCSRGWLDNDNTMDVTHSYYYKMFPWSVPHIAVFETRDECSGGLQLPAGDESQGYMVDVVCVQIDGAGAQAKATFSVKVLPPVIQRDEFLENLNRETQLNGELVTRIMEDNTETLLEFVRRNSDALRSISVDIDADLTNYTALLRAAESELDAMPTPRPPEEAASLIDEITRLREQVAKLKDQKNKTTEILDRMAATLPNVQIYSLQQAEAVSGTVSAMAKNSDSLGDNAKDNLAATVAIVLSYISETVAGSDPTKAFDAARPVIDSAAYILRALAASVGSKYTSNVTDVAVRTDKEEGLIDGIIEKFENTTDSLYLLIVPGEYSVQIHGEIASVTVTQIYADRLNGLEIPVNSCACSLPSNIRNVLLGNNSTNHSVVQIKAYLLSLIPYTGTNTAQDLHSATTTLELETFQVENLSEEIEIWVLKMGPSLNCTSDTLRHGDFRYLSFNVPTNTSTINIDIRPSVDNITSGIGLSVWLKKDIKPNQDDEHYVLPDNGTEYRGRRPHPYMVIRPSALSNDTAAGLYWVRLGTNVTAGYLGYESARGINYTICSYTSDCKWWDATNRSWSREGCRVGPLTNSTHTQCLCTHLTSLASDFFVAPNPIDWSKITLANLLSNFTVAGVLLTCIGLYLLLLIPARRADRNDLKKIGLTPIPSNDPRDKYGYELKLFTGYQTRMGTTSKVSIILSGSEEETQPRVLTDTDADRVAFKRSSVDSFLVTVPGYLGELHKLRIWHDHSGDDPSWFLIRVLVRDVLTNEKVWFICNRWMALEEEDGKIQRVLFPASRKQMTNFNMLFQDEARKNLSDSHLWFSCAVRPAYSSFTRVQRMTCCLCVLITTMVASCMFYQIGNTSKGNEVKLGPIRLSVRQIGIAVISSLVVVPINVLVVNLFKKARPKNALLFAAAKPTKGDKYIVESEEDRYVQSTGAGLAERKKKKRTSELEFDNIYEEIDDYQDAEITDEAIGDSDSNLTNKTKANKKKKSKNKDPYLFPHWVIYIAYVICFLAVMTSAVFTVFYSLTWGKERSEAWVSAMLLSFGQDVLISQPIKVLALSIIFALIIKDPNKYDSELPQSAELGHDEEWVYREEDLNPKSWRGEGFVPKPIEEEKLYNQRQFRIKQKEMRLIIREIVLYLIYLTVLIIVAYGSKDSQAFPLSRSVNQRFVQSSYSGGPAFESTTEPMDYWLWVHTSLLPTLKPQYWYGPYIDRREEDLWLPEVIQNKSRRGEIKMASRTFGAASGFSYASKNFTKFPKNVAAERGTDYIIGVARLRQLRVKREGCPSIPLINADFYTCSAEYSFNQEDEDTYKPGWERVNASELEILKKDKTSPWLWKTAWELGGTPYWGQFHTYWGGGYIADIGQGRLQTIENLQSLELELWIDRYTRAIFAEFALYNAYVNFFCVVNLLTEVTPTGGYFHFPQIRAIRLYRYRGADMIVIMVFEIIYFIFLLFFTYGQMKRLFRLKKKYFSDPWSYVELIIIVTSFSAIGLYFARLAIGQAAVKRMKNNPDEFISFNYVQVLDDAQNACLSFAVFFAFLKFLKLLRFNRRMGLLARTVTACAAPLFSFFAMFIIVFLAYVQFAFTVFGPNNPTYSSFSSCLGTQMSMTLGGFDFRALQTSNRLIGPIFFFSYMVFVFTILMNVFIAIINESLEDVSSDVENQPNDYEILDFITDQFKHQIGLNGEEFAVKPIYIPTKTEFERSVCTIESLADNIEYAMSNTIVEDQRQSNWLQLESLTLKKIILLKAILVCEEVNYTEDDLADAIQLFEKYLLAHNNVDAKDLLFDGKPRSPSDVSLDFDDGSDHGYQQLQGSRCDYEELENSNSFALHNLKKKCSRPSLDHIYENPTMGGSMYEALDEIGLQRAVDMTESQMLSGSSENSPFETSGATTDYERCQPSVTPSTTLNETSGHKIEGLPNDDVSENNSETASPVGPMSEREAIPKGPDYENNPIISNSSETSEHLSTPASSVSQPGGPSGDPKGTPNDEPNGNNPESISYGSGSDGFGKDERLNDVSQGRDKEKMPSKGPNGDPKGTPNDMPNGNNTESISHGSGSNGFGKDERPKDESQEREEKMPPKGTGLDHENTCDVPQPSMSASAEKEVVSNTLHRLDSSPKSNDDDNNPSIPAGRGAQEASKVLDPPGNMTKQDEIKGNPEKLVDSKDEVSKDGNVPQGGTSQPQAEFPSFAGDEIESEIAAALGPLPDENVSTADNDVDPDKRFESDIAKKIEDEEFYEATFGNTAL